MPDDERQLYQRLLDHELHDLSHAIGFNDHLMRSNGWSHDFAVRAIAEYRKFIFLAMVADHQVTPSDQVDQVWHLHLLFSDAYWNDFCPRVLGRPLHHEPTRGGAAEQQRFQHLYRATLTSYRQHFGDPPLDLWPPVEVRFGRDLQMQRRRIRPPFRPWRHLRAWWSVPGLALLLIPLSAAVAWADDSAEGGSITLEDIGQWLWILAIFVITFWATSKVLRPLLRQPARRADAWPLTNTELAYLAEGPLRVLQLTLAELVLKGLVVPEVQSRSLVLLRDRLGPLHGLPQQMVSVHQFLARPSSSVVTYDALIRSSHFSLAPLLSTLQEQQLMLRGWARLLAQTGGAPVPLVLAVWVISSGFAGLAPPPLAALVHNPAFVPSFAGVSLALADSTGRTIWGDKVLEQHQDDRAHNDPLRRVALLGPPAMTGGRLDDLRALIEGVAADIASSCGCGC
ncbi:MAG: TIGR04222 domain-containing membrane protein [Cyanobium sp.]